MPISDPDTRYKTGQILTTGSCSPQFILLPQNNTLDTDIKGQLVRRPHIIQQRETDLCKEFPKPLLTVSSFGKM